MHKRRYICTGLAGGCPVNFYSGMNHHRSAILSFLFFSSAYCVGQDTLPNFKLIDKGNNKVLISWVNPYGKSIRQLSIQRSSEPFRNFRTILTLPDATVPQNGFADTKAPGFLYYRLYILLDSGKYVFSKVKRPRADSGTLVTTMGQLATEKKQPGNPGSNTTLVGRFVYIKRRDSVIAKIEESLVKPYRDSVTMLTKDTLHFYTPDTLIIKPYLAKEVFRPSKYVFSTKEGLVKIILPDAANKKYTIQFFDENNVPVFEIKQITSSDLTLDKANFLHAGWFRFELYEDSNLKEKNKVLIMKEF
jgi:hypothetical protein